MSEKQKLKRKLSAEVQHSQNDEFKYKNESAVVNNTSSENYWKKLKIFNYNTISSCKETPVGKSCSAM